MSGHAGFAEFGGRTPIVAKLVTDSAFDVDGREVLAPGEVYRASASLPDYTWRWCLVAPDAFDAQEAG